MLYAPALVYMLPEIPDGIGRIFPTYYLIQPLVEITRQGGMWASVAPVLAVLAILDLVMIAIVAVVGHRAPQADARANLGGGRSLPSDQYSAHQPVSRTSCDHKSAHAR